MVSSLTAGAVTDEHVITVLRPFVRGTRPVLDALRESDPLGLRQRMLDDSALGDTPRPGADDDAERGVFANARDKVLDWVSAAHVPGTPAWAAMDADHRTRWWIGRMGRFTALLAAVPGIGGALADRLPVQDALGAAGQGLLLCAIAGEYGVRDEDDQIRLLASVLFDRDVDAALAHRAGRTHAERPSVERPSVERPSVERPSAERPSAEQPSAEQPSAEQPSAEQPSVEQRSAELTEELIESRRKHGRFTLRAVAATVWRMGRLLWGLGDELGKRPQGRWYHKLLGMLPLVGMAGDYLGERSALRRVAKAGCRWIERHSAARV